LDRTSSAHDLGTSLAGTAGAFGDSSTGAVSADFSAAFAASLESGTTPLAGTGQSLAVADVEADCFEGAAGMAGLTMRRDEGESPVFDELAPFADAAARLESASERAMDTWRVPVSDGGAFVDACEGICSLVPNSLRPAGPRPRGLGFAGSWMRSELEVCRCFRRRAVRPGKGDSGTESQGSCGRQRSQANERVAYRSRERHVHLDLFRRLRGLGGIHHGRRSDDSRRIGGRS
jgi:hypothetical protein